MSTNEPPPVVYVVDDHAAVRDALSELAASVGLAARTYGNVQEFLDDYQADQPGCLVLDVRMPGTSGLELLERLPEYDVYMPVIVITGHGDVPMSVRAMKAGALEFLEKPFNEQTLLERIREALALDAVWRRERRARHELEAAVAQLTPREREVLEALLQGKPNKAIAGMLGISRKTLDVHRRRIQEKLRVDSYAELIFKFVRLRAAPPGLPWARGSSSVRLAERP